MLFKNLIKNNVIILNPNSNKWKVVYSSDLDKDDIPTRSAEDDFKPPSEPDAFDTWYEYEKLGLTPKAEFPDYYEYYTERNWIQKNGNRIRDWKAVMRKVWFKNKTGKSVTTLRKEKKKSDKLIADYRESHE